jgi:hypothetical protein
MINSTLMLFSLYNKNTVLMNVCAMAWIFFMLSHSNFQWTPLVTINLMAFLMTTLLLRKIKNNYLSLLGTTSSILLYSICVDVICYYIYPQFVCGQNLLGYVVNGLLFNSRYVLLNGLIVVFCILLKKTKNYFLENIFLPNSPKNLFCK